MATSLNSFSRLSRYICNASLLSVCQTTKLTSPTCYVTLKDSCHFVSNLTFDVNNNMRTLSPDENSYSQAPHYTVRINDPEPVANSVLVDTLCGLCSQVKNVLTLLFSSVKVPPLNFLRQCLRC